jgi:hypothetical protein
MRNSGWNEAPPGMLRGCAEVLVVISEECFYVRGEKLEFSHDQSWSISRDQSWSFRTTKTRPKANETDAVG